MVSLDKQLHFFSGGMLAALALPFGMQVTLLVCFVAAVGKEIRDGMGYGTKDVWDAVATMAGAFCVIAWNYLAIHLLKM